MEVFIYCKFTLHVSGFRRTHRQENLKINSIFGYRSYDVSAQQPWCIVT